MDPALSATEYRLLIEHSPVMIWRSGLDAKCDYFNEVWLGFTGRTLAQEMGDGWAEGVHPDDLERCVAHYLDHFHRHEAFEMEYRLRRHDGVYRWIFDRGVPFADEAGEFAGFIGSCVDVDERRRAQEAQEEQSEQQLAKARDFERWMLAIVSHDIRNPLNAAHIATQFMLNFSDPDSIQENVEIVARSVRRIRHIVDDLLDVSRERQGRGISIAPKPTDLRAVCEQVIAELIVGSGERVITCECEVDGTGRWDEDRVLQAISNLVSNALEHGTRGAPVRIHLTGDERCVTVAVQNEGSIPSEILPRLFEPFRSARQQARRGEGLGLGLFIAQAIARAHGGSLEVESSGGRTTFRLLLPRQMSDAIAAA